MLQPQSSGRPRPHANTTPHTPKCEEPDNVTIDDIIQPTIFLEADPDTYNGPWGISSERIGIPYAGLDALMRHFNEHPEDRPLLATPQGVNLVNEILAAA